MLDIDGSLGPREESNTTSDNNGPQVLTIPAIILDWSRWIFWHDLKIDARNGQGIKVPNYVPGVYEVRYVDDDERLTIGKASNLRHRVKQGLVKGKSPHSSGDRIRAFENLDKLIVRWANTNRPSAAEEELHLLHIRAYGRLPKYTDHT